MTAGDAGDHPAPAPGTPGPFSSFKTRLFLSFALVFLLPVLLAAGLGRYWTGQGAIHEIQVRLQEAGRGLAAALVAEQRELRETAERLSRDHELIATMARHDRHEMLAILARWYAYGGFEVLEVGDSSGRVLARGHKPEDWGQDKSRQSIIRSALEGRSAVDIETGFSGVALRAVAPIIGPDAAGRDTLLGTIMVGDPLDSGFIDRFQVITGVELAIFHGQTPIVSTLPALVRALAAQNDDGPGVFRDGDHRFDLVIVPILRDDGVRVGSIAAARNWSELERFLAGTTRALWLGLLVGAMLAAALAATLVRLFTRPVDNLSHAMQQLEKVGLAPEIVVTRDDEFGNLERGFNRMAARLAASYRKLERLKHERVRSAQRNLASRLTAEVAHEIRNPLNAMAAQIELLRQSAPDDHPDRRRLDILSSEIRRLDRTVEDLITEARPLRVQRSRVEVEVILDRILALEERTFQEKRLTVVRRGSGGMIYADEGRLHQAFLNIILNAVQSMTAPGRIELVVNAREEGGVRVTITDTGRGMSEEEKEAVFETWFTTREGGSGLGLPNALRIIEAHGGTIDVESALGKGTMVEVVLPPGAP